MHRCRDKNIAIFTVCNVAYLDKAMVLAESVYEFNKIKTDIFVFDKIIEVGADLGCCNLHWIEELEIPNFKSLSFKYTIIELSTALKPWLALKLLESHSKVVFFDADVMVFNHLESVFDDLEHYPVIITPHYFFPKINGMIDDERIMRFGSYNLGFFAVNCSQESKMFLYWWSDRCLSDGFDDAQFGIFTDQKWVSIAQCFFPFIQVSYNNGLNVAFWNLDERTISKNIDGQYIINKEYLMLFFHFSSFDKNYAEKLSKKDFDIGKNKNSIISELGLKYLEKLNKFSPKLYDTKYSFDYMSDGRYISPSLRRAYAALLNEFPENHDPFDSNSVVGQFAKKNHLFQKKNKKYSAQGYNSIANHKRKLKLVYILMRCVLRMIGPNNFMNFSRLLVYLSSYQRNQNIWKI